MDFKNIQNFYFLGIGGIGMSALARYFNAQGKFVCGYDKTATKLTDELLSEGISIHFEDNTELIPAIIKDNSKDSIIVYTPAVPTNHSELNYFKNKEFTVKKRSEVLGLITENTSTLAVAGTHGKTTTSSLLAHIFETAKQQPTAFLGGITKNYNTNLLLNKNSEVIIVEADEYDRSFLTLSPEIAVITSIDADHLDIYGEEKYVEESYTLFAQKVRSTIILKNSFAEKIKTATKKLTYSLNDINADYHAKNIEIKNGNYHYDIVTPSSVIKDISLGLAGLHNVENSIAACAIAKEKGIDETDIIAALKTFQGVKRRFDYQLKTEQIVYIDDYAHHPEELKATINSAKKMYPNKKITGIFQPHLYSRTRDFAKEFAKSLDLLDECILLDIYPARELPIEGVSSKMLLDLMTSSNKSIYSKTELIENINSKNIEVLLTMGAGDIDTLTQTLKNKLLEKYN
jgi:UDP-N-acetylmuramate--alanine ligase